MSSDIQETVTGENPQDGVVERIDPAVLNLIARATGALNYIAEDGYPADIKYIAKLAAARFAAVMDRHAPEVQIPSKLEDTSTLFNLSIHFQRRRGRMASDLAIVEGELNDVLVRLKRANKI
jgi:hypothetical protein